MSQANLKEFPNAAGALHETRKFFTDAQKLRESEAGNKELQLDEHERTPDGMIELGWEHLQLQRDLHLDYLHSIKDLSREQVHELVEHRIKEMNATRDVPVDAKDIDEHFLRRLSEPDWLNTPLENLADQPEYLQEMAAALQEIDSKLALLSQDEDLRQKAHEQYKDKTDIIKAAISIRKSEATKDGLALEISAIYERVARSGRPLNKTDHARIARLEAKQHSLDPGEVLTSIPHDRLPELTEEINRLLRKDNRHQLEEGLLLTEDMQEHVDKTLPSLIQGRPALLVGETGGAKTALAQTISRKFMGKEPELVSFHGEMDTYQLIGKYGIVDGNTVWLPGPAERAMEFGKPLILDEINAASPEFLKRLNVIMQLRPGDVFTIQENSGKQVKVQPGFCIIATANEKSMRYKGVDVMSAEFKNRFGVNVRRVEYPDSSVVFGQVPADNLALAEAALADHSIGEFAVDLPKGQLEAFVKAAHASQKLFSGNYGDGRPAANLRTYVEQDRIADNKPGLEDTVISPRMMVAILEQVCDGMGRIDLTEILRDWVKGIEKPNDRAVMTRLFDDHTFDGGKTTLLGNPALAER